MDPKELLSTCKPAFEKLLGKFGNGSASLGILKGGKAEYYGLGNETTLPDENTVDLISSMTKPIFAVAIGIRVRSGAFQLDTSIDQILGLRPIYNHRNDAPLRVVDLLDHRSEFYRCDRLWEGPGGNIGIRNGSAILGLYQCLPPDPKYSDESGFRGTRNYNNLCYAILAMIIEKTTGISWAEFIHAEIFDPLGMARSTADMSCRKPDGNVAVSYCAQVEGWELSDNVAGNDNEAEVHLKYLARVRDSNPVAVAQPVQPSRCSDNATYIGAAAGIRSTVSDLFKFYNACITISNNRPNRELTKFEAGVITVLDHINACVQDPMCAYAGGWNLVNLPWDHNQRAPCADGDNYGRLQAIADLGIAELRDKKDFWPFFQGDPNRSQQLAWFHGGNMVGATSAVIVIPNMRLAVVCLCSARSFLVDAANMMTIMLADSLYSGRSKEGVFSQLDKVDSLSHYCATQYLVEVSKYETALLTDYERGLAPTQMYRQCMGTYTLTEGGQRYWRSPGVTLSGIPISSQSQAQKHFRQAHNDIRNANEAGAREWTWWEALVET